MHKVVHECFYSTEVMIVTCDSHMRVLCYSETRLAPQALNAAVRSGADDVKAAALETMGNLAFARPNRVVLLACEGLREWLARLAEAQVRSGKL